MPIIREATVKADVCSEFLDLDIHCHDTVFRVHRTVVCARSNVLKALCSGTALYTTIEVSFNDSDTFELALNYCYTGGYELDVKVFGDIEADTINDAFLPKSYEEQRWEAYVNTRHLFCHLREHANVFALGDTYDVVGLSSLALQKFRATRKRFKALQSKDFLELATGIFSRDEVDLEPLREELLDMAAEHKFHLALDKDFLNAISTRPELQPFGAPIIEALATIPRQKVSLNPPEVDSFAQMVEIERDTATDPQLDATKAQLGATKAELEALRSEHEKATKALIEAHAAELGSLSEKHEAALLEARTGLPTPQNRRELLDHLNGLARRNDECRHCGESPLPYTLEWRGIGSVARCKECGTKHHL